LNDAITTAANFDETVELILREAGTGMLVNSVESLQVALKFTSKKDSKELRLRACKRLSAKRSNTNVPKLQKGSALIDFNTNDTRHNDGNQGTILRSIPTIKEMYGYNRTRVMPVVFT
tara:strand:+ start:597 stop:950 length:354 start_codon:yes stop_codon:yes gene_type:complete